MLENVEKNKLLRFVALGMDSIKIIYNLEKLKTLKINTLTEIQATFSLMILIN